MGSVSNAATVIAALHQGEKRLVFCDSRQLVEELGAALRERGVTTFLSHASLSLDERRRAEQAFAEGRDCVIVVHLHPGARASTSATSTGSSRSTRPPTVAAFLQRLGRTGRRPGAPRNCLFLALTSGRCCGPPGCCTLWGQGYVEPVVAPPEPRHIVAQQLLALCLQEHRVGEQLWAGVERPPAVRPQRRADPAVPGRAGLPRPGRRAAVHRPEAEQRFGRRHFMGMMAVFTAPPEFTVLPAGTRSAGPTRCC